MDGNTNGQNDDLAVLLRKYPFLRIRNVFTHKQCFHSKSQNLKYNHYNSFKGTGWEGLWKRYLERLFRLYDEKWSKDTRKSFMFHQIKEKFGTMRIYTSFYDSDEDLEEIAEMLSYYTCYQCGKEPRDEQGRRVIWFSRGYMLPYCKECAKKFGRIDEYDKETQDEFSTILHTKDGKFRIRYAEKDGWLVKGTPERITDEKED